MELVLHNTKLGFEFNSKRRNDYPFVYLDLMQCQTHANFQSHGLTSSEVMTVDPFDLPKVGSIGTWLVFQFLQTFIAKLNGWCIPFFLGFQGHLYI